MTDANPIPHESIVIDLKSLENSGSHLIGLIEPTWISKKIIFKRLGNDDCTIYYKLYPDDQQDNQHGIVIKVYPTNSDVYTDHQKAFRLIEQLVHQRIAPRILLTFINGYFSTYILGKTLNVNEDHTYQWISRKLAEFHSLSFNSYHGSYFIDRLKEFIDLFTKKNSALYNRLIEMKKDLDESADRNAGFFSTIKSAIGLSTVSTPATTLEKLELQLNDTTWTQLSTEIDTIQSIFQSNWSTHNIPIVLCLHNMSISNFLFDSKNKTMSIIDFDHCSYNYFLIDVVSYFLELAKDDYEHKYPSRPVQKLFFMEYLKYTSLNLSSIVYDTLKPIDQELERLCDLCGVLIAPIHLYWALWAFLQALLTTPMSTFDYINYGKIRLAEYQKHKANFFLPLYYKHKNIRHQ